MDPQPLPQRLLGFSAYEWLVIGAGWAGWGFDVFDAVLFNFVAPNCIPTLLHLPPGTPAAHQAVVFWTGAITSVLLLSWAAGGVLFGWLGDRLGRKRALFATIAIYALGTGLCALVSNLGELILCRTLASLGIGGEWGIGAALIAETVAPGRRVTAGVIMQTASPLGIVLAGAVNYQIAGVWFASDPHNSWRYVFLAGLAPLLIAFAVRLFLRESAPWEASRAQASRAPTPRQLFTPELRRATLSGVFAAVTAVLTWWACNAFIPLLGSTLATEYAAATHLAAPAARQLAAAWQARASNAFNLGGLCGALAAIPLARFLGRRQLFITYFLFSAAAIGATFGLELAPALRLNLLFLVGAGVYGVFGVLTFYLPELFPARLRATGAGFCYNIGRIFAASGPFIVGMVSARAGGSTGALNAILCWVALAPLTAALLAPRVLLETRGRTLAL
ncbi:MAG TPA: MFS transporter [Steroidobacteraceae bacterium]|nr:MFS transporter [Steroidobacteraceae bacterium]